MGVTIHQAGGNACIFLYIVHVMPPPSVVETDTKREAFFVMKLKSLQISGIHIKLILYRCHFIIT